MKNLQGYWTGEFSGTNQGGITFGIEQNGTELQGVATMNEPTLGLYQYMISGKIGAAIQLKLIPVAKPDSFNLGIIEASCRIDDDGALQGKWKSTIGTHGAFLARRYTDPAEPQNGRPERSNVFISYSHQDKDHLDTLMVHLKPLEKKGLVDVWADTRIQSGALWKKEIESALNLASAAILLVSPDFLASDFVVDKELPTLLAKSHAEGLLIIPIILRPCGFTRDKELSVFQAANDPAKPLASLPRWMQDQVYDRVAADIEASKK